MYGSFELKTVKKEGSSATDFGTDVTDIKDRSNKVRNDPKSG